MVSVEGTGGKKIEEERKKKKRGFSSISHYWVWLENKIFPESINASIRKKKRKTEKPCSWLLNRLLQDVGVPWASLLTPHLHRAPCSLVVPSPGAFPAGASLPIHCPCSMLLRTHTAPENILGATYNIHQNQEFFLLEEEKYKWMFLCSTEIPRAPEAPRLKPPLG